jgi:hypothetical protein
MARGLVRHDLLATRCLAELGGEVKKKEANQQNHEDDCQETQTQVFKDFAHDLISRIGETYILTIS